MPMRVVQDARLGYQTVEVEISAMLKYQMYLSVLNLAAWDSAYSVLQSSCS